MNNQLKLGIEWRAKKTPELIEALYTEVKMQMLDVRRCLIGLGNYSLCPRYKKYYMSPHIWSTKSSEQKEELFRKFLTTKTTIPLPNDIKATNVEFSIPQVPSIARKPNQRKRPRTERATPRYL